MMENPERWGELERRIHEVRREWEQDHDDEVCGLSLERRIAVTVQDYFNECLDEVGTVDTLTGRDLPVWSLTEKLEQRLFGRSG